MFLFVFPLVFAAVMSWTPPQAFVKLIFPLLGLWCQRASLCSLSNHVTFKYNWHISICRSLLVVCCSSIRVQKAMIHAPVLSVGAEVKLSLWPKRTPVLQETEYCGSNLHVSLYGETFYLAQVLSGGTHLSILSALWNKSITKKMIFWWENYNQL